MLDKFRGFLQPENAYDAFGLALLYASLRFYGASSQTAGNTFTCGSGLAVVSPGPAAVVTLSGSGACLCAIGCVPVCGQVRRVQNIDRSRAVHVDTSTGTKYCVCSNVQI
jgi:hypothetical protein